MKKLLIVGGGGFGSEVAWLASCCGYEVVGFLDDNLSAIGTSINDVLVVDTVDNWPKYADAEIVIGIGNPRTRRQVVKKMCALGNPQFATLIHPDVRHSNSIRVGEGSVICAGSILTTNINIGRHNILNLNVTVGHDCRFDDYVTVAPMVAISGNVQIGACVEVGTGACIRQGVTLAKGSMLGMGGVLTKDTSDNSVFVGNPAKILKELPAI